MAEKRLASEYEDLKRRYQAFLGEHLSLDLSRGKPSKDQLDLSMGMLETLKADMDYYSEDGVDTRNYGCLTGLPEAKKLMADVMETSPENVIIFCDSSLNIMYDLVSKAYTHGIMGSTPWCKLPKVKFLCPVPGYDRHFAITEYFGIEMISIPMNEDGPDMDLVEKYVTEDDSVKGIWCVPKYSNPTGTVYSDAVVERFASLSPKAQDFRIFWDNAYNVHHLDMDHPCIIREILELSKEKGHPDLVYKFGSFSKISFSGSSIAALATSEANIADVVSGMQVQTIGHNKINQLRHARFFVNREGVLAHMKKHAAILKPKFDLVDRILTRDLTGYEQPIAFWSKPKGGYFVSFETLPGLAKEVIDRMKTAGVVMTEAGAAFPYHRDPEDRHIRIAPSYARIEELEKALSVFTVVVKLVTLEKYGK